MFAARPHLKQERLGRQAPYLDGINAASQVLAKWYSECGPKFCQISRRVYAALMKREREIPMSICDCPSLRTTKRSINPIGGRDGFLRGGSGSAAGAPLIGSFGPDQRLKGFI